MERHGEEIHIDTDEARGGTEPHVVRWVLAISLVAAVVLLSLVWIIPAMTVGRTAEPPSVGAALSQQQEDNISSEAVLSGADATRMQTRQQQSGGIDLTRNNAATGAQ